MTAHLRLKMVILKMGVKFPWVDDFGGRGYSAVLIEIDVSGQKVVRFLILYT